MRAKAPSSPVAAARAAAVRSGPSTRTTLSIGPCPELVGRLGRLMVVTCEQAREHISALVDGELPPGEATELASHLARCESCTRFEAHARTLHRRSRLLPAPPRSDLTYRVMTP